MINSRHRLAGCCTRGGSARAGLLISDDNEHHVAHACCKKASARSLAPRPATGWDLGEGISAGENRVARLCSRQQIWPVLARRRGLPRKAGPPVHDDLAGGSFTPPGLMSCGLTDMTEYPAAEGKLCLCAIKTCTPAGSSAAP